MIVLQPGPVAAELRALAEAACAEAARRAEAVLLSYGQPAAPVDALRLYRRAVHAGHDAAYWEQPWHEGVMVAAGSARTLVSRGARRFADTATAWRRITGSVVSNRKDDLVALAGFAFAAEATRAAHWSAFGDGALVVPELLYRCDAGRARVTLNVIVQAGQSADSVCFRLASLLDQPPDDTELYAQVAFVSEAGPVAVREWSDAVTALTQAIEAGSVEKVVLAREVALHAHGDIDEAAALARLRKGYPSCTVFAFRRGAACFMGATPERLVRVEGRKVHATCLAGSARRGTGPQDDEAIGAALLADGKERREHQLVVGMIADALTPLCSVIDIPSEPTLMRMPNVQHLFTPVAGTLSGDVGVLELADRLHPTPAVGGMPRDAALRAIGEHESFDRGWYAGPVGWIDARGDGEFAVALRSALIAGSEARLFAGCGIVAGSDPRREYEESTLKLRPMLWALDQA